MEILKMRMFLLILPVFLVSGPGAGADPSAAIIVVTTDADAGVGSFRQAILDSNATVGVTDTITFNISGAGVHTIVLLSALPDVTDPVIIDAASQPGYSSTPLIELNGAGVGLGNAVLTLSAGNCRVIGLAINRGPDVGIRIRGAGTNRIYKTFVGTDPTGTMALGNASHGILIENVDYTFIGDPTTGSERSVVAGNGGDGVHLSGPGSANASVGVNCAVGTDPLWERPLGNAGWGVYADNFVAVQSSAVSHNGLGGIRLAATALGSGIESSIITSNNGPGISEAGGSGALYQFNTISGNSGDGVVVHPGVTGTRISENKIFANGGLAIDLGADGRTPNDLGDGDAGANNLQNFPVLWRVDLTLLATNGARNFTLFGEFHGVPLATYRLEFYSGTHGKTKDDAQVTEFITSISGALDASGSWYFSASGSLLRNRTILAATATDAAGNTSEISIPLEIPDQLANSAVCGTAGFEAPLLLILLAILRRRRR